MNDILVTSVVKGQPCVACGDPIVGQWGQYDKDLKGNICADCGSRMVLMTAWLAKARIKNCIQPSTLHGQNE